MEALVERVGSPAESAPAIEPPREIPVATAETRTFTERATRVVNFLLALVALVALLPLLVAIALLVKLSSRGPVFYTQERVGLDRRSPVPTRTIGAAPATWAGGRSPSISSAPCGSMPSSTPVPSGPSAKTPGSPRSGRLLRQYRLDELPQFINVLRGEMNIVGPRPERPTIFAELREHIAEYPLRQRAKPGITGLAQINHHYDRSLDDVRTKVTYDLEYIRRQSLVEDLRIMLKTVPAILFRRGGW